MVWHSGKNIVSKAVHKNNKKWSRSALGSMSSWEQTVFLRSSRRAETKCTVHQGQSLTSISHIIVWPEKGRRAGMHHHITPDQHLLRCCGDPGFHNPLRGWAACAHGLPWHGAGTQNVIRMPQTEVGKAFSAPLSPNSCASAQALLVYCASAWPFTSLVLTLIHQFDFLALFWACLPFVNLPGNHYLWLTHDTLTALPSVLQRQGSGWICELQGCSFFSSHWLNDCQTSPAAVGHECLIPWAAIQSTTHCSLLLASVIDK